MENKPSNGDISDTAYFGTDLEPEETLPVVRAKRSRKDSPWTQDDDKKLAALVELNGGKKWKEISQQFEGRSQIQCFQHWQCVLSPTIKRGPWTPKEDARLVELVKEYGLKKWSKIAENLPGRLGKRCRERWYNHLSPELRKDPFTQEEEMIIMEAHQKYGNRWAEIARLIPSRAPNDIKNLWYTSLRKVEHPDDLRKRMRHTGSSLPTESEIQFSRSEYLALVSQSDGKKEMSDFDPSRTNLLQGFIDQNLPPLGPMPTDGSSLYSTTSGVFGSSTPFALPPPPLAQNQPGSNGSIVLL